MKNLLGKAEIANILYSWLKSTGTSSSRRCIPSVWQEPKAPKCLIDMEINASENEK